MLASAAGPATEESAHLDAPDAPDFIKNWVRWGAGPRASQYLILGAKALALLSGKIAAETTDVRCGVTNGCGTIGEVASCGCEPRR